MDDSGYMMNEQSGEIDDNGGGDYDQDQSGAFTNDYSQMGAFDDGEQTGVNDDGAQTGALDDGEQTGVNDDGNQTGVNDDGNQTGGENNGEQSGGVQNNDVLSVKKIKNRNRKGFQYRHNRYNQAYGNYRGGYGNAGFQLGFEPPPFQEPFTFGRGFGPMGPPSRRLFDDAGFKYLLRCGIARDSLKKLPPPVFEQITPTHCFICNHSFDSFAMSKLHYLSKNHAKILRKWLFRNDDSHGSVPMKSRDLYCELCDVHITSKQHADAHYAGRPHRAIVEGRRQPKNPMLLQWGMEARLDQLVRREKKCLKPVEESVSQDVVKEVKLTQPELYCDICKTAVTCSEQMTMHLNGKRHLSKEKQHILNMMKGTSQADSTNAGDENYGDDDENFNEEYTEGGNGNEEEIEEFNPEEM